MFSSIAPVALPDSPGDERKDNVILRFLGGFGPFPSHFRPMRFRLSRSIEYVVATRRCVGPGSSTRWPVRTAIVTRVSGRSSQLRCMSCPSMSFPSAGEPPGRPCRRAGHPRLFQRGHLGVSGRCEEAHRRPVPDDAGTGRRAASSCCLSSSGIPTSGCRRGQGARTGDVSSSGPDRRYRDFPPERPETSTPIGASRS
jgi:hypothetical protein